MRVTLTNIIKEILESNGEKLSVELNEGTQFKEIGLTSFDLAVLTVEIENIYDIDVFEDGLISTIGEIEIILKANQ
jgi:acyl carrier protein